MDATINIDKPFEDFRRHLEELPDNDRIIFSGRYGIGKSYFLREFFKETENSEKYFPLFINPVNYSSAQTHDIIQLIKFDVFYQLLEGKKIKIEDDINLTASQALYYYLQKDVAMFIPAILAIVKFAHPEIDNILDLSGSMFSLWKKLQEKVTRQKNEIIGKSDKEELEKFFTKIQSLAGSPYEDDFVQQVINYALIKIKQHEKKKVVLVIDDLDRLDPDNMFRILNVLSAHSISGNTKSAFESTPVILVCDIDNVKATYKHRYGEKSDFEGFMDKFYSNQVFRFRNTLAIKKYIKNISNGMSSEGILLLKWILHYFLTNGKLNVRQLRKATLELTFNPNEIAFNKSYDNITKGLRTTHKFSGSIDRFSEKNFISADEIYVSAKDLEIFYIFQVIKNVIGEENLLFGIIDELSETESFVSIGDSIHMLDILVKARVLEFDDHSTFFGINNFMQMTYPEGHILNWKFGIQLKWKVTKKYDGTESYFTDSSVGYEGNVYENVKVRHLMQLIKTNFERINNLN